MYHRRAELPDTMIAATCVGSAVAGLQPFECSDIPVHSTSIRRSTFCSRQPRYLRRRS
jgi:hypothetical protein